MRQWTKCMMIVGLGIAAVTASADEYDDVSPYLGAEYNYAYMKGSRSWKPLLPSTYPGASFYVGTKFHQYFGIEIGYDWSIKQKKEWSLPAGTPIFGTTARGSSGSTKVERSGGHVDVVGFLPVADSLELIGSIGAGWLQTKIESTFNVAVGSTPETCALASVAGKGRAVFRVGVGALYMLTDTVGLRARMRWEGTSNLEVTGNQAFVAGGYTTKAFRGTTAFSVGAFFKF